jgi:hypothetical protein
MPLKRFLRARAVGLVDHRPAFAVALADAEKRHFALFFCLDFLPGKSLEYLVEY